MSQADTRNTTVKKVSSAHSPKGDAGQIYLASGITVAMRMWKDEQPGEDESHSHPYEVVGYVIAGKAKLHVEGQMVTLEAGDSWVVPKNVNHRYEILEPFTAVEATSPPFHVHGRNEK